MNNLSNYRCRVNWVGYYQTAPEGERAAFGHSEDVDKQTITFTGTPQPPDANFSGTPTTGTAPLEVSFTDSSTGDIDSWSWDFDNNGTEDSTVQNPTHTYSDPGTYTVTLEVTGPGGTDTRTEIDYITVTPAPQPPVAEFSGAPRTGVAPLEVSFTDSSTGDIDSWSWDFDNNGTEDSTVQNPTHTYSDPGTYTVTLEVTGPGGSHTRTRTNYITITAAPTQYTLMVNTVGEGSVTLDPPSGTYDAGTVVELTPVSDAGWAFNGWSDDLTGYSNPATIVMNADKDITATFDLDWDDDGISDAEEDGGPNGGDGNSDGVNDSDQLNVASFHTQHGTNYVTLVSAPGTLTSCRAVSPPSGCPTEITFPYGFIGFTVNDAAVPPDETTVTLYLPAGANPTTYWKYGRTPTNQTDHWYEFLYDGETGAEINENVITLHFIDGKRGDDILTQDGMIVDQGGPGVLHSSDDPSPSGGTEGGGCFISTAGH